MIKVLNFLKRATHFLGNFRSVGIDLFVRSYKKNNSNELFQVRTKLQNAHKKELEDLSKWVKVRFDSDQPRNTSDTPSGRDCSLY